MCVHISCVYGCFVVFGKSTQVRKQTKTQYTTILNNCPQNVSCFLLWASRWAWKLFQMLTNELHDKFYGVNGLQAKEDLSITAWWGLKRDSPQ